MAEPSISERSNPIKPPGETKGAWTTALEQGANLLQTDTPLKGFDVYVVGFHCAKGEPTMQMEAHHFCRIVNDEVLQCVLFDGNTVDANLIGIEYIISGRLFETLPEEERPYWHPHNFEILSGQLVAPGLPEIAERALMRRLMNSYGKTWHTWHTSSIGDQPGMELPLGDPKLMWSFNRLGECDNRLIEDRDRGMGLDTEAKRRDRRRLVPDATPQYGVDDMRDDFADTSPIAGVEEARSQSTAASDGA